MLKSKYNEDMLTPNQYAKELIEDKLYLLLEGYWEEELPFTEKELKQVREQLQKRCRSVLKYLGVDK